MFAKAVDVFHKIFKAANSRLAFYIVLQAAGAAQVWPVKLSQQRAFASVYILQRKCVRGIIVVFLDSTRRANSRIFFSMSMQIIFWKIGDF